MPLHQAAVPEVVIAGGGIAAIEAALALRALAGVSLGIELVAPQRDFVYRALSVAEPFGQGHPLTFPLGTLEALHGVRHRQDAVAGVEPARRRVLLRSGATIAYDALIVAVGARPQAWLDGAVTFTGPDQVPDVRRLLEDLRAGERSRVLFAAAPGASWTLPLYDLALLTAAWCADEGVIAAELTIATPELDPLAAFGPAASAAVRATLGDRGIRLVTGTVACAFDGRDVHLTGGRHVPADAVLALPRLLGNPLAGLPASADGFIPVDRQCAVASTPGVWAVGDATTQPVKQGGIAAQQADVAASAVAASLGIDCVVEPYRPELRGLLLTGITATFLRRDANGRSGTAYQPLWWPPTKVAGRHVGPLLRDLQATSGIRELAGRGPGPESPAPSDREEIRRLAREFAEADAAWGDARSALRWLDTLERLQDGLEPDLERLRERLLDAERLGTARVPQR